MCCFLLGSRYRQRPKPTPEHNPSPNPNPDPDRKPQPKRAKIGIKRGCVALASNQEISQLRRAIPKCRSRYAILKKKKKKTGSQIVNPTQSIGSAVRTILTLHGLSVAKTWPISRFLIRRPVLFYFSCIQQYRTPGKKARATREAG